MTFPTCVTSSWFWYCEISCWMTLVISSILNFMCFLYWPGELAFAFLSEFDSSRHHGRNISLQLAHAAPLQLLFQLSQLRRHRPINKGVPDPHRHATDQRRIHLHLEIHRPARPRRQ